MPSCAPSFRFPFLWIAVLAGLLGTAPKALAAVVISEVDWAGSDLSASDEWVEIAGVGEGNGADGPVMTMSGWTLTSMNSSGNEVVLFRFPATAQIAAGEFLVISHFVAAQSRLLHEPLFVTSAMSLPNTKLLLRLRDASGNVIDQADDGTGDPMAGQNITSPARKATMERIYLTKAGSDSTNWATASAVQGFDDGAAMSGTPGFPRVTGAASSSSATSISSSSAAASSTSSTSFTSSTSSTSSSSSSFSSISSISSSSSTSSTSSTSNTSSTSSTSQTSSTSLTSQTSCPPWDPFISLQSGNTVGDDRVTLNIQILQRFGSLGPAACSVDFGDGAVSASCNPPQHTFDRPGSYTIRAEVRSSCNEVAVRTLAVTVAAKAASSSSASPWGAGSAAVSTSAEATMSVFTSPLSSAGATFLLTGVLPNPTGKDDGREWIEITNLSLGAASIEGWTLRLPHARKGKYTFGSISFGLRETKRFRASELGMTMPNSSGELSLLEPGGRITSSLAWTDARDGVVVRPQRTFNGAAAARVTHIVDGDTLDVELVNAGAGGEIGRSERVRMIGIDAPELSARDELQRILARRAVEFLRSLLEGSTVTLTPGADARDTYGRLLAYVATKEDDSVQEMLLREGLASIYLRYAFAKESEFIAYQREAQEAGQGLWMTGGELRMTNFESRIAEGKNASNFDSNNSSSRAEEISITHLTPVPSSSSSTAAKKKSSSSSQKRVTSTKRPAARVAAHRSSSRSSSHSSSAVAVTTEEINMSPLFPIARAAAPSLTADLLAVEELIERPDAKMPVVSPSPEPLQSGLSRIPLIFAMFAVVITSTASGITGWRVGRSKKLDVPMWHLK